VQSFEMPAVSAPAASHGILDSLRTTWFTSR
jgi:hypothetical protein